MTSGRDDSEPDGGSGQGHGRLLVDDVAAQLRRQREHHPAIVVRAAAEYRPLHITNYVFEVAKRFNDFYHACPVLISGEPTRTARLTLVAATRTTLKNGLALLGIEAPEAM